MAKPREFTVKESALELKVLRKKQSKYHLEKRIIWLESIMGNRFKTRKELAEYLDISTKTQERWTSRYMGKGMDGLLIDEPKNLKSRIITPAIHDGLKERVNSSTNPFLGYWDAKDWVLATYGVAVQYHLIRHYLIQHFKTKLKSPRKSHYKKDEEAEKAFLKTT
jgi:transposase